MKKVMLTMKDVIREGNSVLRETASDVSIPISNEDKEVLQNMFDFVKASQVPKLAEKYNLRPAVGLAAPQINVSKRMIAVLAPDKNGKMQGYALFNAHIVKRSEKMIYIPEGEGCLSVDREVIGVVPRHAQITVEAVTLEGEPITLELDGFLGIVFQHEIDHLDGFMFYDYIRNDNPMKPPTGAIPVPY